MTARAEPGATVEVEGVGAGEVPTDESNLVVRSIAYTFAAYGIDLPGLDLVARNSIPHGRGMGSSGAAIVSGIMAAKGLLEGIVEIDSQALLALATALEGHPDNVAPALFGGLTIAWMTPEGPRHKKLIVHRGVSPLVAVPVESIMSTALARSLQPESVPHEDAVFNVSRSALLIAALIQSPELLLAATEDKLHQSYRASAMPETDALIRVLRDARSRGRRLGCRAVDPRARQRPVAAPRRRRADREALHHAVELPAAGRRLPGCYSDTALDGSRGLSAPAFRSSPHLSSARKTCTLTIVSAALDSVCGLKGTSPRDRSPHRAEPSAAPRAPGPRGRTRHRRRGQASKRRTRGHPRRERERRRQPSSQAPIDTIAPEAVRRHRAGPEPGETPTVEAPTRRLRPAVARAA